MRQPRRPRWTPIEDRNPTVQLPSAPLLEIARIRTDLPDVIPGASTDDAATDERLGQELGVDRRTISRWRSTGVISFVHADRAACALGLHLLAVWPDAYRLADAEAAELVNSRAP